MLYYDAHNHVHDERLGTDPSALVQSCAALGIAGMVVNGSSEEDWTAVRDLADRHPEVIPSFGYHPWHVHQRSRDWQEALSRFLDTDRAVVGEIGLDRWILEKARRGSQPAAAIEEQEEVFLLQLNLAAERDLPVSIHCLQAWGRLLELLRKGPLPRRGLLLHSYGGSLELVEPLAGLGAYFSLPGYYLAARKVRQREAFQVVPFDRLLIETDAPDQPLPSPADAAPEFVDLLGTASAPPDRRPNQPSNLLTVYRAAARLRDVSEQTLANQVEENFHRLFLDR